MKRRALYVSAFLPDAKAPHAGGQVAQQNREALAAEGYAVTSLICTTETGLRAPRPDEHFFAMYRHSLVAGWLANLARGRATGLPAWPAMDTRAHVGFERRLRAELERGGHELVFADFTQVFLPVWRALRGLARRPELRLCVHDVWGQKLLRDPGVAARLGLGATLRMERTLLQSADAVLVLSPKDRDLVSILYDCAHARTKAFVPPDWVARVQRTPARIRPREIVFFANFDRPENADALDWFARYALEPLAARFPDFTLVLAGAGSDRVPLVGSEARVRRTGFIDDPGDVYAHCRLAVAPLRRGAGVKFKVLEALAAGVPVLGTPVALEGVAPGALIVEAPLERFVERLIGLLES